MRRGQGELGEGGGAVKTPAGSSPGRPPPLPPADEVTAHRVTLPTILHVPEVTGSSRHRVE